MFRIGGHFSGWAVPVNQSMNKPQRLRKPKAVLVFFVFQRFCFTKRYEIRFVDLYASSFDHVSMLFQVLLQVVSLTALKRDTCVSQGRQYFINLLDLAVHIIREDDNIINIYTRPVLHFSFVVIRSSAR